MGMKQQKALPIIVPIEVLDLAQIESERVMAELIWAAFFLAIQPCKYIKMLTISLKKKGQK